MLAATAEPSVRIANDSIAIVDIPSAAPGTPAQKDAPEMPTADRPARDASFWAQPVSRFTVTALPPSAINLNVDGRRATGPLDDFGPLNRKTYGIRLSGSTATPAEVVSTWKRDFSSFWPKGNSFYGPHASITPGDVGVLNLTLFGPLPLPPRQLLRIAGNRLPSGYRRSLERYRYGPGVYKIDWALDGPIPWTAQECNRAATVHLGGTLAEIAASERAVWQGTPSDKPYVLLVQHSLFDPTRAPAGKATVWGYCHVPNGSTINMTERIEQQIERFAPGFRDRIIARSIMPPAAMEQHNANDIGGDINGGVQDLWQLYTRPAARLVPYTTPTKGIYICSSSTPPGGGVHGMCGYFAARAALRELG